MEKERSDGLIEINERDGTERDEIFGQSSYPSDDTHVVLRYIGRIHKWAQEGRERTEKNVALIRFVISWHRHVPFVTVGLIDSQELTTTTPPPPLV